MIFDFLLLIGIYFVKLLAFLLPKYNLIPTQFHDALIYFFSTIAKFNFIFPIDTLFWAMYDLVLFMVAFFVARIIVGIVAFFTGKKINV